MELLIDNVFAQLCAVLPDRVVRAAELCSVPHGLEDDLGESIISDFLHLNGHSRSTWVQVKMLPFVYPYEGNQWRFSDAARAYFSNRLEQRDGTLSEVHQYLSSHYQEEHVRCEDRSAPWARELEWRSVYHLAPNAPAEAVERLTVIGEQAAESNRLADLQGVVDLFDEQQRWLSSFNVERAYFEGRYAYAKGNYPTAETAFRVVWERRRLNHMQGIAGHLLGKIIEREPSWRASREVEGLYRESLRILQEVGDRRGEAMVLNSLGRVLDKIGGRARLEEAERLFRQSLRIGEDLGMQHHMAMVLNSLGRVLDKVGGQARLEEAERLFRESLRIERKMGNRQGEAMVLNSLGRVLDKIGGQARLEEAERLFRESLRILQEVGDRRGEAMVLNSLGRVLDKVGGQDRLEEAERLFRESLRIERKMGNRQGEAMVLNSLGRVLDKVGGQDRLEEAERLFRESLRIGEDLGMQRHVAMVSNSLASLAEKQGDIDNAIRHVEKMVDINRALSLDHFVAQGEERIRRLKAMRSS